MDLSDSSPCFVSLLLLFLCLVHARSSANGETCHESDLEALEGFSSCLKTPIDGWGGGGGSQTSDCCSWTGVTCDNSTSGSRRVVALDLGGRNLGGEICDAVTALESLRFLNLSLNSLSTRAPWKLFQMHNLEVLDLGYNFIGGHLPCPINLPSIRSLNISFNNFFGPIAMSLTTLCSNSFNLRALNLAKNYFYGDIRADFGKCTSLEQLSLRQNLLSGDLPGSLFQLLNLGELQLQMNSFSGELSEEINLGYNDFTSELPSSFKSLQSLRGLSLSGTSLTNLSSALQTLQHCKNLESLFLSMSFRDEEILVNASFQFYSLKGFAASNSRLKGSLPSWLSCSCQNLQVLDLSGNRLSGRIPDWISEFPSLYYLDLSNNSFTGEVPERLTELRGLRDLPSVSTPFFVMRQRAKSLRMKALREIVPPTLDLSNNWLRGPIWPAFGNLTELKVLRLKNNKFSGYIPESLSGLRNLDTLDLSCNSLSGRVPESFDRLGFMLSFNVSHNKLYGKIPEEGLFPIYPYSSFEGNNGLCGLYLEPCGLTSTLQELFQGMKNLRLPFEVSAVSGFLITTGICFLFGWMFKKAVQMRTVAGRRTHIRQE
ncbi:phytosulfokine receptor 1-like [Punica granatum]|uniref:Phytosulfokine receptor 1-like n=1 Tax=Punica granatum TaxID=22663 RepID=A0A6P8CIT1_PUNGR|nr:phytosulfokine receptor 1-like [Punica granatum]